MSRTCIIPNTMCRAGIDKGMVSTHGAERNKYAGEARKCKDVKVAVRLEREV